MARSEDAWIWFEAVYEAVQEIPAGKVTTYGHIAKLLEKPERPRQVGVALKHLPATPSDGERTSPRFHGGNVPWQRVINSKGGISPRGPGGAQRQAEVLERERVEVSHNSMGEYTVDLSRYGWFPEVLPSEAVGDDEDGDADAEADADAADEA